VADQFAVRCGRCSGKMGDPGIDPTDRIDRIGTIRGDPVADEEIFRDRFVHPFFEPMLFFNRPSAIADFPDLIMGLKLPAHRAGLLGHVVASEKRAKEIFIYIVPIDPAYKTEVRGHVPAVQRLAEGWSGNKNNQKENKKRHRLILKRMAEDCQHEE
jgi:hypothetical protein